MRPAGRLIAFPFAKDLLGVIPDERLEDLVYFDPTHRSAPAFNPLALPYQPPNLTEDLKKR